MQLEVKELSKSWPLFGSNKERRRAVDGVSFELARGEALGLVGESGCGKSTLARLLAGAFAAEGGTIAYAGRSLNEYSRKERAQLVQIVFQDPASTLHPRRNMRWQLSEALRYVLAWPEDRIEAEILRLLALMQLPERCLAQFPHELSGGQKQRIVIARALSLQPQVMIADEALSALDRLTQFEIMDLLRDWCDSRQASLLLIAHDLSVVQAMCDRVAVMYGGQILEWRASGDFFSAPAHPYSLYLLQAMPQLYRPPHLQLDRELALASPETSVPQSGCVWAARCPYVQPRCQAERPSLRPLPRGAGNAACHRLEEWGETSL